MARPDFSRIEERCNALCAQLGASFPFDEMSLPIRMENALRRCGFTVVGDLGDPADKNLALRPYWTLRRMKAVGKKTLLNWVWWTEGDVEKLLGSRLFPINKEDADVVAFINRKIAVLNKSGLPETYLQAGILAVLRRQIENGDHRGAGNG